MKKIALSILTLTTLFTANAQRKGLWIAPQLTIGAGTMTGVSPSIWSPDASAIFMLGADAYYMFTNNIGVGTGIHYGGYGTQFSSFDSGDKLTYNGTQVTFDVPVFLRLVSGNGGGFFAHFGVTHSFMLTAEETLKINGSEYAKVTGSDAKVDFQSYSISPFVYFGGNVRCGNKVQMTIGPSIQYQLNNNFSNAAGLEGHYLTFALKVGVGIQAYKQGDTRSQTK
jgi:hypothetical protein